MECFLEAVHIIYQKNKYNKKFLTMYFANGMKEILQDNFKIIIARY